MTLIRFLLSASLKMTLLTIFVALLSGAFSGAVVAVVHRTIESDRELTLLLGIAFVLAATGKLITGYFSEVMLTRRAQTAVAALRLDLVRKLQRVPFKRFEELGQARILTTFTDDVASVSQGLYQLPAFTINVAVSLGGALYLVYLSWQTLFLLGGLSLIGALVYRFMLRRAWRVYGLARDERDRLNNHLVTLTRGMKELKLHRPRRHAYTEVELQHSTDRLMELDVKSHSRYILAHSTTHFFLMVLIGLIVFVSPQLLHISETTVTGYVLIALFLMGPLSGIAGTMPVFSRAGVAVDRIRKLGISFDSGKQEKAVVTAEDAASFMEISLNEATCVYEREGDAPFTLGPVNLKFGPGELIFITGGNGSGKSTLAKLLTGLYAPGDGQILWNGTPVTDENRDDYRQLYTTVFSDFFLFESLLGLDSPNLDTRAQSHLKNLGLDKKVRIEHGALSTVNLSTGQRKRLALLTAYLENRPIYVFDEWAADQDPSFRKVFYEELIHDLKAEGKTILVITHDDRYFHLADRHFEMRDGQMAERDRQKKE